MSMFLTLIINAVLIVAVVMIHYEVFVLLSRFVGRTIVNARPKILVVVFGSITAHVFEIWLYGFAYYFMIHSLELGSLVGNTDLAFMDIIYFSFTTYTSLGFGDIEPLGPLRFVVGLEALTGLVLITWTASFLVLEMQKIWSDID